MFYCMQMLYVYNFKLINNIALHLLRLLFITGWGNYTNSTTIINTKVINGKLSHCI
jgi:hypothetical protein